MKKITLIAVLLVTGALVLNSCKKKEDDVAPAATKTSMLPGTWKMTAYTVDPAVDFLGTGTPITDVYSILPAFSKDDLLIFKSDKSYTFDEGATKFADSDPQIKEKGTWAFNSSQSHLILTDDGGDADEVEIKSMTSSKIMVVSTDSIDGKLHTFNQTLTKQ